MATDYKYGTQAELVDDIVKASETLGRYAVAIGTSPINLVRGYAEKGLVNKPLRLTGAKAKATIGYSKDWKHFTLSEVVKAFFDNVGGNVEPLYVINILNPDTHRKADVTTKTLSFVNGQAEFESDTIILDTLAIADKAEGVDYTVSYNFNSGKVIIDSNSAKVKITGTVELSYYEVDYSFMENDETKAEVFLGGVSETGVRTGLEAFELVYMKHFVIANYLIAPRFTHIPSVRNAMVAKVQKFNDMFDAMVYTDIPTDEDKENLVDTRAKAITWKNTNNYKSEREVVNYPKAKDSEGNIYCLSTLRCVEQLKADQKNNCIPYETAGNKPVNLVATPYIAESVDVDGYTRNEANELTRNGISTLIPWKGVFKLWGHHTSVYTFSGSHNKRATFDTSINMLLHLINSFTNEHADEIDKPMKLSKKQEIEDIENEKLRQLVALGALLEDPDGASPFFRFDESENPTGDIIEGAFTWNLGATPTPPFASGTAKVAYTDAGFNAYLD